MLLQMLIAYFLPEPPARGYTRRKSVFAEAYDPENDADEGEKVVYPKSDLQRSRLADAVRNILLFRSLDPVSSVSLSFKQSKNSIIGVLER
jgi:hypothetical protein